MLGATGTIGMVTARTLAQRGHDVICIIRAKPCNSQDNRVKDMTRQLPGCTLRIADVTDPPSLARDGFRGEHFDAVVSCMASRTGERRDAQRIDYQAHMDVLELSKSAGVTHMVLLSAICVQRPKLAFQKAKLAFESALVASGLTYSIVRPTAFFKSLSGQVDRLMAGKAYLMFGNGTLTACKPISDDDLAAYIADCLEKPEQQNRVLPIGGPGPAISPKEQGEMLFALLGQAPRYRSVPPGVLLVISKLLATLALVYPPLRDKAEYARIGHYYATESMLVLNEVTGRYDADSTPSTGTQTLRDHFQSLIDQKTPFRQKT